MRLATAITIGGFIWIVAAAAWVYLSSTGIVGVVLTGSFAVAALLVILGLGTLAIQEARARGWLRGALAYRELHVWYADQDGYFVGDLDAYGALRDSLETLTANAAKLGHRTIPKGPNPVATRPPDRPATVNQPPTPDEFKDAPHLLWSSVRAIRIGKAYEVVVLCNNTGRIAQVIPTFTWVQSTVDVLGPPIPGSRPIQAEITRQDERIEFVDFDTSGQIQPSSGPGPFNLRMRCIEDDPVPGEREIKWRVTYMDDDMSRGYITECAARIAFVMGAPRLLGIPALDNTSRKQRNDDYNQFMKDKKAPSTGPRRPHS